MPQRLLINAKLVKVVVLIMLFCNAIGCLFFKPVIVDWLNLPFCVTFPFGPFLTLLFIILMAITWIRG